MTMEKCDICKKEIKDRKQKVSASHGGYLQHFEFCADCGKPIEKFLKKHKLLKTPYKF